MPIPIMQQAVTHQARIAIIDDQGEYSYSDLLNTATQIAVALLNGQADLQEARIAFLAPSGFSYVAVLWGIWLAGGVAVPLCASHPAAEMRYVLQDSDAAMLIAHPDFEAKLRPLAAEQGIPLRLTSEWIMTLTPNPSPSKGEGSEKLPRLVGEGLGEGALPDITPTRRALILYTSGTTSKPKGVVSTHANLTAQITSLIEAWGWTEYDHILHVLPLHHTHGIVNVLLCALWAGAVCEMMPKFEAEAVWQRFMTRPLTLFMAVPTIYGRLIAAWEAADSDMQARMSASCQKMRLMVSGSAALPATFFEQWQRISGHALLERYGMTEMGMALSNPLQGERRVGFVGLPLPGVTVRLVDDAGAPIDGEGQAGQIQVKGANVFHEYWQRPEATEQTFQDGWFITGDVAIVEQGYYRILGRSSVDIIKTGGYKVSALEIEEVLRTHPAIEEVAVIGLDDPAWGEQVAAVVALKPNMALSLEELRYWAKEHLAIYKIPQRLLVVAELPRNVMGKVTKPDVKRLFN